MPGKRVLLDGELAELMEQVRRIATCSTMTTETWQDKLQEMASEMWSYYVQNAPNSYSMEWVKIKRNK